MTPHHTARRHPHTSHAWRTRLASLVLALCIAGPAFAQGTSKVVDIPTRAGVTQRFIYLTPAAAPKGSVILMAGGHGGLQIYAGGSLGWGNGNFLVRTRQQFADAGFAVAVVDAPSDRQKPPFLNGFRQTPEHAADIKAVIAWLKQQAPGRSGWWAPAAARSRRATSPPNSAPRRAGPTASC
ncbi:MAG: hypothetical protein V4625_04185 [Pseudomonadota bacterium]